eukprot:c21624_g6_i1.p1 GENE.c21624_g6_i1~~c21624_g6_i1.p1  ORF type:complete len:341 (+),score=99.26 c21624_g6_i1:26-1024(+)
MVNFSVVQHGLDAIIACLIYCVCSNAMVLSNKAILSLFKFNFPLTLMLLQASATGLILVLNRLFQSSSSDPLSFAMARKVLPLNILFVLMICSSGYAIQYLSVPFLTIFKNLTNVFITFGEGYVFGKNISNGVLVSIGIMVAGSICAAYNDIEFSPPGYFWMFVNCIVSAFYALYMKWVMDATKLSTDGMALYNNLIGIPMILFLVLLQESSVVEYPNFDDTKLLFLLVLSCFIGFGMSLSTFYAMRHTSPTTYSMVGALNKIPASILGAFFFNAAISAGGWFGIGIGLCGGIVFTLAKAFETKPHVAIVEIDSEDGEELESKEQSPLNAKY